MTTVTIRSERIFDATAEQLWPLMSDSDRSNRAAAAYFPLRVEPLESNGPQRQLAETRMGIFLAQYEEAPAQFVQNEWMRIHRIFRTGPFQSLTISTRMHPTDSPERTRVALEIAAHLRWPLLAPVAWAGVRNQARWMFRFIEERLPLQPGPRVVDPRAPIVEQAFARARTELLSRVTPSEQPLAERLLTFVAEAADMELVRIRPFSLADAWGVGRDELLGVCLHSALSGLLELRWDIVCPSCQTGSASVPTLAELGTEGHCQLCDLRFDLDLDRAVEAVFSASASVRQVPTGPFCLASPSRFPHVIAQAHFLPGVPLKLRAPSEQGRFRLFVRGGAVASVTTAPAAPSAVSLLVSETSPLPGQIEIAPGGDLELTLQGDRSLHVKLERLTHLDAAATAYRTSSHPLFRRHFSGDLLKPGLALAVARVALVFTDLTGSTAMYSRLGEPVAFRIVLDHFELLRRIVERHGGTVVKTIGDAVMASFPEEKSAIKASLEMIDAFPAFVAARPQAQGTGLKVGAFVGPCYAVRANEQHDYFGQTVNTAARIQGEAESNELVTTAELALRASALGDLDAGRIGEPFEANLKGLPEPLRLVRVAGLVRRS